MTCSGKRECTTLVTLCENDALDMYAAFLRREGRRIALSSPQLQFYDNQPINPRVYGMRAGGACADGETKNPDEMVAFLATRKLKPKFFSYDVSDVCEIGLIYTHERHRKLGYARKLLQSVINSAEHDALTRYLCVYMQTCIQDPSVLKIYSDVGFRFFLRDPQDTVKIKDVSKHRDIAEATTLLAECKRDGTTAPAFVLVCPIAAPISVPNPKKKRRVQPTRVLPSLPTLFVVESTSHPPGNVFLFNSPLHGCEVDVTIPLLHAEKRYFTIPAECNKERIIISTGRDDDGVTVQIWRGSETTSLPVHTFEANQTHCLKHVDSGISPC